jgi:hypothetical protein
VSVLRKPSIVYGARVWMGWEDPYVAFFELPLAFHGPLLPRLGQTRSLPRGILRLFALSNYVCIPRLTSHVNGLTFQTRVWDFAKITVFVTR